MDEQPARIGVVGTGFISKHFVMSIDRHDRYEVSRVLTRRPLDSVGEVAGATVTDSIDELLTHSDVILECSGDPIHATDVIAAAVEAGLPVVTMNTEFHITAGSYFVGRGIVTEAEGDQPGCQAALHEDAVAMGFEPIVYGNMKGFLNEDPTPEDMAFWGEKQGISLPMVTSFTDGTKVQAEQILVANYFGGTIGQPGMVAPAEDDLTKASEMLAERAHELGQPIADYVVSSGLPHGVFVVASHDERQAEALRYYKMGDGPHYVLIKRNIFVHFEILKTIERVLNGGGILLDNSAKPVVSLAAMAKRDLSPGERIPYGIGSFDVRGHSLEIAGNADHMPIGLLKDAVVERPIERGQLLTFENVAVSDSLALKAWKHSEKKAILEHGTVES
jgi:predicted homoserine dehydrogenase-like protein